MDKHSYIAVFDSGVGGVSVLRELRRMMPEERFCYFGDSANAPYGKKTTEQVRALTLAAGRRLLVERDCKALVVACNTATAAAITDLRAEYPDRIVVGIEPALKLACDRHPGGTIGIMATDVTLREQKLATLMERVKRDCRVLRVHAPGAVELVEQGKCDTAEAVELMQELLGAYVAASARLVRRGILENKNSSKKRAAKRKNRFFIIFFVHVGVVLRFILCRIIIRDKRRGILASWWRI